MKMKKAFLIMATIVAMITISLSAASDTIKSVDSAKTKISTIDTSVYGTVDTNSITILPSTAGTTPDPQLILYLCAFIGLLARAIWNTYKGVKSSTNGTPTTFDFQHWLEDNVLSKVSAVMGIIIALKTLLKMPDTLVWQVVMCVFALLLGIFADFAADKLKWLTNKTKVVAISKQIEAVTGDVKIVANAAKAMGLTSVANNIIQAVGEVDKKVDEATK